MDHISASDICYSKSNGQVYESIIFKKAKFKIKFTKINDLKI